jgi:hypothetical protein
MLRLVAGLVVLTALAISSSVPGRAAAPPAPAGDCFKLFDKFTKTGFAFPSEVIKSFDLQFLLARDAHATFAGDCNGGDFKTTGLTPLMEVLAPQHSVPEQIGDSTPNCGTTLTQAAQRLDALEAPTHPVEFTVRFTLKNGFASCPGVGADKLVLITSESVPAPTTCEGKKVTITRTKSGKRIGSGSDVVTGTSGPDVINGGFGDDIIDGLGGVDTICGSDGDDFIDGGGGNDRIFTGSGRNGLVGDVAVGGPNQDLLVGFQGTQKLRGGPGNDTVFGGPGDDELTGGAGKDELDGGPGRDQCDDDPNDLSAGNCERH